MTINQEPRHEDRHRNRPHPGSKQMNFSKLTSQAALAVSTLVLATAAQANCFTVHDAAGKLIQQTTEPPVDLSLQLGDTVPQQFGQGAHLIFSHNTLDCPISYVSQTEQQPPAVEAAKMAVRASESPSTEKLATTQSTTPSSSLPNYSPAVATSGGAYYNSPGYRVAAGPLQTGPRGGTYYINSNGNKSYVSRGGGGGGGRRR